MTDYVGKIILGLDPALASIGYGVICDGKALDYGVIATPAKAEFCQRLMMIRLDIKALVKKHQPIAVGIEQPFFGRQITSAGKVLKALGVIELALADCGLTSPIFIHQSQVKKCATGNGKAEKKEMQAAVMRLFNLNAPPKPDDAADGLAIAYAIQQGVESKIK